MISNNIDKAAEIISKAKKIVAFTGAGISAELIKIKHNKTLFNFLLDKVFLILLII